MIHICHEEIQAAAAVLAGGTAGFRVAWVWIRNKLAGWKFPATARRKP